MKKITILFTVLIIVLLYSSRSWAATVEIDGLKFTTVSDTAVSVSSINQNLSGKVVIPPSVTIDGKNYTVTTIAKHGFENTKITSVAMFPTIEEIGEAAFYNCQSLNSVVVPSSVKKIGEDCFSLCYVLDYIQVIKDNPNFRNVGKAVVDNSNCIVAFPGNGATEFSIPEGIKGVKKGAFHGCNSLTDVFIPSSVEEVGAAAFEGCSNLKRVKWDAVATKVPFACFSNCAALKDVILSQNVNYIDGQAFSGAALTRLVVLNPNPFFFVTTGDKPSFSTPLYENTTVVVPSGRSDAYSSDDLWHNFIHIEELKSEDGWQRTIIVSTLDGSMMEHLLDRNTKIRIEQPNLVIETDGTVLTYELNSMSQIRYGRKFITTGISTVAVDAGKSFKIIDNVLSFDNLRDNSLIEIYTVDGKQVMTRRCSGHFQVPLGDLTPGIYLLKVNSETYKIQRR